MKLKQFFCMLMALCMLFQLSGCKGGEAPVEETGARFIGLMLGDDSIEEWTESNTVARVCWQKLKLEDEYAEKYPNLTVAFDKYNEESLTEAKAIMFETLPAARENEGEEFNPTYFESKSALYVQRADSIIVSLLEDAEIYTGGMHPNYYWHGRNYNPNTGEEVKLSTVLTDTTNLSAVLEKKITEKYSDVAFNDLKGLLDTYAMEDFSWTIDYQGITFHFSPYDIAAFAVGKLSAKIWFDECPEMFNKEYFTAPEKYVVMLPVGQEMEFDLISGDDKRDAVLAETYLDSYGEYHTLSITVNGKTYTDEINYAYDSEVYLAHVNGKNYIYSDSCAENDYHTFVGWDINGEKPSVIQELYGTEVDSEYIEEGYEYGVVYTKVFNNPESFTLETRLEILGTRGGVASYRISDSGKAEMTDAAYSFNYGFEVVTAMVLDAQLLPDMKPFEIGIGEKLTPYQTDGKSYVDLKTEDDRIIRLQIDASEWPLKVNGVPEDECFEEIMYAG